MVEFEGIIILNLKHHPILKQRMRQTNKASSPPSDFKKVGHVYMHPEDATTFYSPVTFRDDPNKFRPLPREDPRFKEMRVYKWGLYELEDIMRDPDNDGETCYSDDKDYAKACSRMQMFRTMYGSKKMFWYHSFPNPEEQFINILIDRKLRYIKNHQAIQNACQHCSLTIKGEEKVISTYFLLLTSLSLPAHE